VSEVARRLPSVPLGIVTGSDPIIPPFCVGHLRHPL